MCQLQPDPGFADDNNYLKNTVAEEAHLDFFGDMPDEKVILADGSDVTENVKKALTDMFGGGILGRKVYCAEICDRIYHVDGVESYIDELTITIEYDEDGAQHMIMNGMDVTGDIRTQDISQKASLVSAHGVVRDMLLDMQRDVAKKHNVIMDGRDIGTVVLPGADVKIFLTADPEVRAKRRYDELIAKGQKADLPTILKEIKQRDYQDSHRAIAPLKQAKDAVLVDTSNLDIDGVVDAIKTIVKEKIAL